MGGRAFGQMERIAKEKIFGTLMWFGQNHPALTYDYMRDNLMGSAGKQADSGDLDIAICNETWTQREFIQMGIVARKFLGKENVKTSQYQINMAVPVHGNPLNGYCQVDLIYGNREWLKFTHWSAGDRSKFKGVFISQTFGVLAKMKVIYRYPENAVVDKDMNIDERLAEVAFNYNLEEGLRIRCRMRKNDSFKPVTPDEFETHCAGPMPPRVPRYGDIQDPDTVVRMLMGNDATRKDCETFENMMKFLRNKYSEAEWKMFSERLVSSLARSGARYYFDREDMENFLANVR